MQQPAERDILDEDDDFEEFEVEDWDASKDGNAAEDAQLWEDNWDDDDVEDDFSIQLRAELNKIGATNAKPSK